MVKLMASARVKNEDGKLTASVDGCHAIELDDGTWLCDKCGNKTIEPGCNLDAAYDWDEE